MSSFRHGGNTGDLIFSLPTVRALGGGTIYLAPSEFAHKPFDQADLDNVKPLLMVQPYINDVKLWTGQQVKYDLDAWRYDCRIYEKTFMPLAERYMEPFIGQVVSDLHSRGELGVELYCPWLRTPPVLGLEGVDIVIARSPRRQNPAFPWGNVLHKYAGRVAFVGALNEYESFCNQFPGPVPVPVITRHLLALAEVISSAKLFIGNASCAEAIAEGLGVRKIVEVDPMHPHVITRRPGADYVCGSYIELPDL